MKTSLARMFVSETTDKPREAPGKHKIDWLRHIPFFGIHMMCLGVIWVGWSWVAVSVAAFLYAVHVFALTGFYHRYFSHRSFKTSRVCQFIFGTLGCSALQRGPLWWAAHHRHHHLYSDGEKDLHSPRRQGFFWSHMGWFLHPTNFRTNLRLIPDFAKFPELRFIDRYDVLPPLLLAVSLYFLGAAIGYFLPSWGTSGMQMLIWGFFISTVAVYHVTYSINSLAHVFGRRRYQTNDDSRNNLFLALVSFGEGWHNNHHYYAASARQGFYWWEIDITYYILKVMSWFGLVWNLKRPPKRAYDKALRNLTPAILKEPEAELAGIS